MQNAITILEVLAVLAILFVFATLATRDTEILREVSPDDPDVELPAGPLQPEDIGALRFGMVLRGYRMREVDDVLTRVAADLIARDERILALEQALVDVVEPQLDAAEQGLITPAAAPDVADLPVSVLAPGTPVVEDAPALVAQEPAPVAQEPAPVTQEPAPVAEDPAPVAGEPEPVPQDWAVPSFATQTSVAPVAEDEVPPAPEPVTTEPEPAPPSADQQAAAVAQSEPLEVEPRTPLVEPAPVPEPAPIDLSDEELPASHWPQPALEPEPEPLVPDELSATELTTPVDDSAFSGTDDDVAEVQRADDET